MTELRHREIACAILVDTLGRLLLQRRDDIPGILFPGRIGLFGGHREGNDPEVENGTVRSEFFIADHIPVEDLMITEGALLIANPNELVAIEPQFTPSLRFALAAFNKRRRHAGGR
jgi:8-oxo-dGTP diphosphatase